MAAHCTFVFLVFLCISVSQTLAIYQPTWASLDARPLPAWYDEAKIGIFMHWGVFSVPSFGSEWFWWNWKGRQLPAYVDFMTNNYRPGFTYADFAPMFTTEFFNPKEFAEIIEASGAKYVVLTSKHHEGFTNWPSKYSWNWNSMDVGPKRDLVGELAAAVRTYTKDVHFGLYHSLFEWFNPLFLKDKAANFTSQEYVQEICLPELHEIIEAYKPDVLWSDGDWDASPAYWNSTEFLAWLYNSSPVKDTIVTNDRWGRGTACRHGGYYSCQDRYNPGVLQKHKWENAMTLDKKSWGFRRDADLADYYDMEELIQVLAETISCGGNLLVNIGPTHDGRIVPIFEERLRQLGSWLKVNGEAIYASKPWRAQNDTKTQGVWYTSKTIEGTTAVYAIVLDWPINNQLALGVPIATNQTMIKMLGYSNLLRWQPMASGSGLIITMPPLNQAQLPCKWAWVIKMQAVK
ncbi:alpha-L-fucosidase-like [Asterias rubens]|uniref:alpha-L-fucosidase-like n=1 Tax=Asterias rubens TaxID=7604 RepID=UPI001455B2B7|nr:alpha-L-fucosidase-like [Asterias rubens]